MFTPPPRANHHCRHYEWDRGAKCGAGEDLSRPGSSLSCMPPDPDNPGRAQCPWREEWNDQERAAWKAWVAERRDRMVAVLAMIPGTSRNKCDEWGKSGVLDTCPACKTGRVQWSRSRSNGHLHAACSTPGCFAVIE